MGARLGGRRAARRHRAAARRLVLGQLRVELGQPTLELGDARLLCALRQLRPIADALEPTLTKQSNTHTSNHGA